ncbi:MAG TPA: regulatory protein RecX [Moheibacter sp.]|nr:regulatory protein RecX [Moheibacter sp.]
MKKEASFTFEEIKEKMAHYCAYQDRCHWEVENKMREFNLIPEAWDLIMIELIQQNFLNEERFARSFARGKFNQKKWGKMKIRQALRQKRVPEKLIELGLTEIDEAMYLETLEELFLKKSDELVHERDSFKKQAKIRNYLLQKGFESELIYGLFR